MNVQQGDLGNKLEIIEFYIDEELEDGSRYRGHYGMNVAKVLEIIRQPAIIGMPGKHHPAVLGTFNLRGRVLPLVDLGMWLDKKIVGGGNSKVVVTEFSGVVLAFVVSGVLRIHRMTWAQVEPPGRHLQYLSHDSITGVVRLGERIIFLLDMEQVLAGLDPSMLLENQDFSSDAADGRGYHVLVADDSPSIRNTIAFCLERAGFQVTKSTRGTEAWAILKDWERQSGESGRSVTDYVNLVIADIEMPEMDGHTLTRMIKTDPAFKNIPVILFSSLISSVVYDKGVKAGADDQISKPDLPRLTDKACELIARYQPDKV